MMQNKSLASDYLTRCQHRLAAIGTLYERKSWADVVRESQEVVELSLKGLLRFAQIEIPRIHDVSNILEKHVKAFPKSIQKEIPRLAEISRTLRRDRELAFYGSEDLTPSEFYKQKDAKKAKEEAALVVRLIAEVVLKK